MPNISKDVPVHGRKTGGGAKDCHHPSSHVYCARVKGKREGRGREDFALTLSADRVKKKKKKKGKDCTNGRITSQRKDLFYFLRKRTETKLGGEKGEEKGKKEKVLSAEPVDLNLC